MTTLNPHEEANVLIVDDERSNIAVLNTCLSQSGFKHIKGITDSRQAIQNYNDFNPDIILLDIRMPYFDGFELMEQFKKLNDDPPVPIIVLTAELDSSTRYRALEAGAKDFLTKPFDILEVSLRMANILENQLLNKKLQTVNMNLEIKVLDRTAEINQTRLSIIHRLGQAAEFRDNETGNHIIRMSQYCAFLGTMIGLDGEHCDLLLSTSPMHDVGKIGIPDNILLKPGKLNQEEWEIMKTHVTIGGKLFSGDQSDLMVMAKRIALEHHEKYDGTGYPNGLKGEEISIEGRIVGICDVFDALTSERSYKKAWSVDDAMSEIIKGKGLHFDPHLVEKFQEILPGILRIKENISD